MPAKPVSPFRLEEILISSYLRLLLWPPRPPVDGLPPLANARQNVACALCATPISAPLPVWVRNVLKPGLLEGTLNELTVPGPFGPEVPTKPGDVRWSGIEVWA